MGNATERRVGSAVLMAAAIIGGSCAVNADDYYKGKTVSLYVGSGAGGTNDIVTRLVGSHIKRHLGGEPNIVVKNMPGAGSRKLAAYLYSRGARDGT